MRGFFRCAGHVPILTNSDLSKEWTELYKELPELRASLEAINQTASELITDIDRHFMQICKDRGIQMPMENALKNTDMSMEDDYGMIDGIINNGQKTTTEKLTPETTKQRITELAEAFASTELISGNRYCSSLKFQTNRQKNEQRANAQKWRDDMQNNPFTHDEINLMCIYDTGSRTGLMDELHHIVSFLSKEDVELSALVQGTIAKLRNMTDANMTC